MTREFRARFAGTCPMCLQAIHIGDLISWSRKRKAQARTMHLSCANGNQPTSDYNAIKAEQPKPYDFHAKPIIVEEEKPMTTNGNSAVGNYYEPQASPTTPDTSLIAAIASAVAPFVNGKVDESRVREIISETVQDEVFNQLAASDKYSTITVKVERPDNTTVVVDNAHAKLPTLLKLIALGEHTYLHGKPGSGKSYAAKQAADALGRDYGYISLNPQTPDSRLLGFIDANGVFRDPVFHKLYVNGGVFCIDECDNASPSLLTCLNGCLENGHAAFPCGMETRHENFVMVATGNTAGRGASRNHADRRAFDAAFAERFTFISWEYDTKLERAIALGINPNAGAIHDWLLRVREFCATTHPALTVSPRALFKLAKHTLLGTFDNQADLLEAVLWKGLDKTIVDSILSANLVNWS